MDLNHILLFLAVVSSLLALGRAWRPSAPYHGWRFAALIVLAITGIAWLFWRGAAGYVGGCAWFLLLFLPAIGLRKMTELAMKGNYKSARKLGMVLQILHPSSELHDQIRLFRRLESQANYRTAVGPVAVDHETTHSQLRNAPAVLVLILLNAGAFLFEISVGNWNSPDVLHRIGALEPYAVVVQGEYWRLFTGLFLHGGFTHLFFNVFALYVLGPPLERSIGTMRFVLCYLISGLASGAGVVGLTLIGLVHPVQLVGASGSIMGIVGAWAGFLMRHRHSPHAKQRLVNVVMIVAIQIAFDLSTPQVSLSAHLCGLVAGFFLGLILAPSAVAGGVDPGSRPG
ncbi:MAG TPA: rhomboid family intramembrane serine protease [Candidatus Udaeobacter sp.]|nr:rhomboid family intramembrane serine protease [Candidatus Udaeobacter sp.]